MPDLALNLPRVESRPAELSAVVRGSGVAALTLARLLGVQGWNAQLEHSAPARRTHLLLGDTTARLLAVLWNDPMLLAGAHPIRERAVCWGASSGVDVLPAPGLALSGDDLIRRLAARLERPRHAADTASDAAWIVETRPGSRDADPPMRDFGTRHAWIAQAALRPESRDDLCIMESIAEGWVFLLPVGGGQASLQFVSILSRGAVPDPALVVAATRAIRDAIDKVSMWSDSVSCMPRARLTPTSIGRLAVGEGALAFDPISGDGVGHALRSVVLAASTLHDIATGKDRAECLDGYADTLRRAMAQHLRACLGLYADAPFAVAWKDEIGAIEAGLKLLTETGVS